MRQNLRILWLTTLALLLAAPIAADQGYWILRFGGIGVDSDLGFSEVDEDGTRIDLTTSTGSGAGLSAEYQTSERLGFEFGAMRTSSDVELSASFLDLALTVKDSMTPTTLSFGANVHVTPDSRGDLYLGPVVAYMQTNDVRFALMGESIDVRVDDAYGYGAVLGFDYPFGEADWVFCTSVRYLEADLDFRAPDGGRDTLAYDPLVFGIGLGYRF